MVYECEACNILFTEEQEIDSREEAYSRQYEPIPVYCPECGSDMTVPRY